MPALSAATRGIQNTNVTLSSGVKLYRDKVADPGGKTIFVTDTTRYYGYREQAAPADASRVRDGISLPLGGSVGANDALVVLGAGNTPAFNGGGIDFAGAADNGSYSLTIPAAVMAAIYGQARHYYSVCAYVKLPAAGDFPASGEKQFLDWGAGSGGFNSGPYLGFFTLTTVSTVPTIKFYKCTNSAGTGSASTFSAASLAGKVCQVLVHRSAELGMFVRVEALDGSFVQGQPELAGASDVAINPSANASHIGIYASGNPIGRPLGNTKQLRFYRAYAELHNGSTRNPATVAADDLTRVRAAVTASAAANGGTSLIYV